MTERIPSQELAADELELAAMINERGPNDPETRERLLRWTEEQERRVAETGTSRAGIEMNLRRARLYLAAGFRQEAWENLNDVRTQAHNEGEDDLRETAERLMDEMEGSA